MVPLERSAGSLIQPLRVPLGPYCTLEGTLAQIYQLAQAVQQAVLLAPDPWRRARITLWDGQVLAGTYTDLGDLAAYLLTLLSRQVVTDRAFATLPKGRALIQASASSRHARYSGPATVYAYVVEPDPLMIPHDTPTQPLNARGTSGGLRLPEGDEASPFSPRSPITLGPRTYYAQVCIADWQSLWGWRPIYPDPPGFCQAAEHIVVAGVMIAVAYKLLLPADQMLALRWANHPEWTCFLPAAYLNEWALLVQHHIQVRQAQNRTASGPYPTIHLNTGSAFAG